MPPSRKDAAKAAVGRSAQAGQRATRTTDQSTAAGGVAGGRARSGAASALSAAMSAAAAKRTASAQAKARKGKEKASTRGVKLSNASGAGAKAANKYTKKTPQPKPTSTAAAAEEAPTRKRARVEATTAAAAAGGSAGSARSTASSSHPPPRRQSRQGKGDGVGDPATAQDAKTAAPPAHDGDSAANKHLPDGVQEAVALKQAFSLLRRYLSSASSAHTPALAGDARWNANEAVVFSTFLASLESSFVRSCCHRLSQLTSSCSPAFLHVAALGEAALGAPAPREGDGHTTHDSDAAASGRRVFSMDGLPPIEQLVDRQEQAYRALRATIAASCTLGHRSCQVLWGPRGSGKHRILRLLADDVRRTPNIFVAELQGKLLRDDEAALGVLAQQLYAFLQSPQSAQLRAAHPHLRNGTFGFGQLFHFDRRMQAAEAASAVAEEGLEPLSVAQNGAELNTGGGASTSGCPAAGTVGKGNGRRRGGGKNSSNATGRRAAAAASRSSSSSSSSDSGSDSGSGDDASTGMLVTSTTTYLTGGAASALPHLQRALLLLKSVGCSIVVCIREIDVFGIRCDQLLYVLSGLMHDTDAAPSTGGGLSLVLASSAPDIRQLEKRLSSRLTCETRYVPLLPWSLPGLLAATLHTFAQDVSTQLRIRELARERAEVLATLRDGAARLRRGGEAQHEAASASATKKMTAAAAAKKKRAEEAAMTELREAMAALEARLHVTEARLRDTRAQRRQCLGLLEPDLGGGVGPSVTAAWHASAGGGTVSGWRPAASPASALPRPASPSTPSLMPGGAARTAVAARSWTLSSLAAHPSLSLEVHCVLCEELLRQLRVAVRQPQSAASNRPASSSSSPSSLPVAALAQQVAAWGVALELESSTSATAMSALVNTLCKAASGAVDLLGDGGRRLVLRWLRARLQHESIPPGEEPRGAGADGAASASACPAGLPERVLAYWRGSAQAMVEATSQTAKGEQRAETTAASTALSPPFAIGSSGSAADVMESTAPAVPPLSVLPPHLFDLHAEGRLVGMGYGSREMLLVLFYMHLHHTTGVRQRTVADLLEDVSSSLGTRAAAALDREAFRYAIRLLCRWRMLAVVEAHSQTVQLCGSDARLRELLATVLSQQTAWCEAELGLDAREIMRFRNLV